MRIVTVRASHLAGCQGVRRVLVDIGALILVTGETDIELGRLAKDLVALGMNLVAIVTRHIVAGVLGTLPMRPSASLVTSQAGAASLFR